MDEKPTFKLVKPAPENTGTREAEPALGATGFYYVTPTDAWDDMAMTGRRLIAFLVTLPVYIWRELLKAVILSTAVFSLILMAVFAGQVLKDGVGPYTLIRVLPNFLPLICPFVLPLAIITGILMCYSRLAKDNEILAAYAGGIHPIWLATPALLTSTLAIFVTLTLNEVAMMPAIRSIERLVIEDQANILRRMISRPGSLTVLAGNEYIAMSKMEPNADAAGRSTLDITRFAIPPDGKDKEKAAPGGAAKDAVGGIWDPAYPYPARRIVARDHSVHDFFSDGGGELSLKMSVTKPIIEDLHIDNINKTFIAYGESGEERVSLGGRPDVTIHANRTAFWPILMLTDTRREAEERIREIDSGATRMEELPEARRTELQAKREQLASLIQHRTSEINMRLALCFSSLAFAMLGIPLGMRTRGTLVVSFTIGIAVAGIYFFALKSAERQVAWGRIPYWAIWIPDAVVVLLGLFLWWGNSRRS